MSRSSKNAGSEEGSLAPAIPTSEDIPALKASQLILDSVQKHCSSDKALDELTCELAAKLHQAAAEVEREDERKRRLDLALLMGDRRAQLFSTLLTDRVPRLRKGEDIVRQALTVLRQTGIPRSMPRLDQVQLKALQLFGSHTPTWAGAAIRKRIRHEASPFLAPGEIQALSVEVTKTKQQGLAVNVNPLGEEVLGEAEAERHMQQYLSLLDATAVDTISVKLSSICFKISALSWDASLKRACAALERLYRAAMAGGPGKHKLVMLDMEAYRDLELAHAAFVEVLSREEFLSLRAGIVLQAYVPDSHGVHLELLQWAKERHQRGGAAMQLRLVKGANLAVERVESSVAGWALPIYPTKAHVDASFKVMLERAMEPSALEVMRLGVASHNLFDVAHSMLTHRAFGLPRGVHFEVLTGMGGALSRLLLALGQEVMVYTPAVEEQHRHAAVAYLVRRLDENTDPDNFLHHSFGMQVGDEAWHTEKTRFERSRELQPGLDTSPRRQPVRGRENCDRGPPSITTFENEPDTDFSLLAHRLWINSHLEARRVAPCEVLPLYIAGERIERIAHAGVDPSRPGFEPYRVSLATAQDVQAALACAEQTLGLWQAWSPKKRVSVLGKVAALLRRRRGNLIAALVMDGGKAVVDADAEVSEAIDFAEYYASTYLELEATPDVAIRPRGVTVIAPPWNFPLAIPLGGALAALVAGNTVILKSAQETPLVATQAVEICHEAGIPMEALQLVVATDKVATVLITDPRVAVVVLTGSTQTARLFRRLRSDLYLLAETGGKNAAIVSHYADRDRAAQDTVRAAFGHAGQKCSATSLLIVTPELAGDAAFREQLVDAARSLVVGSAWDPDVDVTPLVQEPEGNLVRGLTQLDSGETWWLAPKPSESNPRLWSPGIRAGVAPGSFSHQTEFFGPVLSVMVARDLKQAIEWANDTSYGLTAGLHSLNEVEQALFVDSIDAGNVYVNRPTTGAIVRRQPFGGRKASSFGPGAKAGGPNYVQQFVHCTDAKHEALSAAEEVPLPLATRELLSSVSFEQRQWLEPLARRYEQAARTHFRVPHDPSELSGQRNDFRYQCLSALILVPFAEATMEEWLTSLLAAFTSNSKFCVAWESEAPNGARAHWQRLRKRFETLGDSTSLNSAELLWEQRVGRQFGGKLRALGVVPNRVHSSLVERDWTLDDSAVLMNPRRELHKYLLEQCVSEDYHRYGHLGVRELK